MDFPSAIAQYITEEGKCRIIQVAYKQVKMLIYVNFFPPLDLPTIKNYDEDSDKQEIFFDYLKSFKFQPYKYYVSDGEIKGIYFHYTKKNHNFLFYKKLKTKKRPIDLPETSNKIFILEKYDPTFDNFNKAVQLLNFLIFLYNKFPKYKKIIIEHKLYAKNFELIQNSNNWETIANDFYSDGTIYLPSEKVEMAFEKKEMNNFYEEKNSNTYIQSKNQKTLFFNSIQEIQARMKKMNNNFRNEIFANIPFDFWERKEYYIYNFYFLDYFPYNSVLMVINDQKEVSDALKNNKYMMFDIKGNLLGPKLESPENYLLQYSPEQYGILYPLKLENK